MSGYVSKDFVHDGNGLVLDPEEAWPALSHAARKCIKQAQQKGLRLVRVEGNDDDLGALKEMWYDPDDPNLPTSLPSDAYMFRVFDSGGETLGTAVLLTVGNHLFLNNLAATPEGRLLRTSDFTLWELVKHFADSGLKYIDVGVSYRESLQRFFKRFRTLRYPVIFNKPELSRPIKRYPAFHARSATVAVEKEAEPGTGGCNDFLALMRHRFGAVTFVPNVTEARRVLGQLGHPPLDLTKSAADPVAAEVETGFIELPRIFPVQFGALLTTLDLDDRTLWNTHMCLDVFKRTRVFEQIAAYPLGLDKIRERRKQLFERYRDWFGLDDLPIEPPDPDFIEQFTFESELHDKLRERFTHFEIDHCYDMSRKRISLPLHQELGEPEVDYVYAIYRGVMNLCSEWTHTDDYKPI